MIHDRFWLTDAQFTKIAPHLPTDTRGKARVDDLRVISRIVHVLKSGGRWIDAPPEYGPRKTLYKSLCPLGGEVRVGQSLPCTLASSGAACAASHRLLRSQGASLRQRG
jgi:transposase